MGDNNHRYTKIEDLMDLTDFFDEPNNGMGKGPNSMDGMPPNPNSIPFKQKVMEENMERQSKMNPIQGKIRKNVDMASAMRGGNLYNNNSGSIYPSVPQMHLPVENTNPYYNEFSNKDVQQYQYGRRTQEALRRGGAVSNNYNSLENFQEMHRHLNCIDIANHIKSCPICSKFYENDKTIYVISIIILVIICIILIKKVLENYEK